jgi:hypothetical protein
MTTHREQQYQRSVEAFTRLVVPVLSRHWSVTFEVADQGAGVGRLMDRAAGIDAAYTDQAGRVWGMAYRMRWIRQGYGPWNTFTIRKWVASGAATEWDKRVAAVRSMSLKPDYTLQANVDAELDVLVNAAVVRTSDLYQWALANPDRMTLRVNYDGKSSFHSVDWSTLEAAGVPIERLTFWDGYLARRKQPPDMRPQMRLFADDTPKRQ